MVSKDTMTHANRISTREALRTPGCNQALNKNDPGQVTDQLNGTQAKADQSRPIVLHQESRVFARGEILPISSGSLIRIL